MSFVAKVFVVFNLIMSAFFLMFATYMWTANTKWQKMYELEKTRKVPEIASIQKLQVAAARKILLSEQRELQMQKERDREKLAVEAEREKTLQLTADVTKANNERELADNERKEEARENKRLSEEKDKMHSIVAKLNLAVNVERNNAQTYKNMVNDLESELNGTKAQLTTAQRDSHIAQNDLAKASGKLEKLIGKGLNLQQLLDEPIDQPALNGKVLAVRSDVGLVMLSVGKDNGVNIGYEFTISKGPDYKAVVQVVNTFKDMSSAKIKEGTQNTKGVQIEINDDAQTHF